MAPMTATVQYSLGKDERVRSDKAVKMLFSPHRLFRYDDGPDDVAALVQIVEYLGATANGLGLYGPGPLLDYLFKHVPDLAHQAACIVSDDASLWSTRIHDLAVLGPAHLPAGIDTVFLCETRTAKRYSMRKRIGDDVRAVCPGILEHLNWRELPDRAWAPDTGCIYPIDIPEIDISSGLDMVLMDLPSRNLSMMPNGLGYVNKALKAAGVKHQVVDGDIILYHRYHTFRLLDSDGDIRLPSGQVMPEDPWAAEDMSLWERPETLNLFREDFEEILTKLVAARPKVLGLSIQQCNLMFCREMARRAKEALPDLVVLVGGYSCRHSNVGRDVFPECDYMAILEADDTVGEMVRRLAAGDRPANTPGYISVYDSPDWPFEPAPFPHDLDAIGMPVYDWCDLDVYRNYQHYQLVPVIATRGCHWGRCRFCGEALPWRKRSPGNFVDELEYMVDQGAYQFVLSESDLNGDPELFKEICQEIVDRGLTVILGGQLRIDRRNTRDFFRQLRAAGFVSLRFGVDGWSANVLKIQNKGYTVDLIKRNLKDCHAAGIYIEVNAVIGCPGETEQDVDDSIALMLECHKYIGRLANINPLQLLRGSIYFRDPETYGIKFTRPREELEANNFAGLPEDVWYSEDPYIDREIRHARCTRVLRALQESGYDFGAGASPKVEALNKNDAAEPQETTTNRVPADPADGAQTSRMFRHRSEYYLFCGKHSELLSAPRKPFWRRALRAFRRVDKWGTYAARIYYGAQATVRKWWERPADRPDEDAPRQVNAVDDSGPFNILGISREAPPSMVCMVKESYFGYNLLRVQSGYVAVKLGYPLDIDKVASADAPLGPYVQRATVKELAQAVASKSSSAEQPVLVCEESQ